MANYDLESSQLVNRENLENLLCSNQTEYWKCWNKLKKSSHNQTNEPDLNTFHEYFLQQSQPPPTEYFDNEHMRLIVNTLQTSSYSCDNSLATHICDSVITEEEVTIHLKKLKCNKAAGIDGIPAEFYKCASEKLVTPFCAVFNYILDQGEYLSGQKD